LETFTLDSEALMLLDEDGVLAIGHNTINAGQENPFIFDVSNGILEGSGMVKLIGTTYAGPVEFAGLMQNVEFDEPLTNLTAQMLVGKLINMVPSLNCSVVFKSGDDRYLLYATKEQDLYRINAPQAAPIIKLRPGDDIRRDDCQLYKVYGYNNDVLFAILSNGRRE
jgi:hypothetical protein